MILTEEERQCLRTVIVKMADASTDELITELLSLLDGSDERQRKVMVRLFIKLRQVFS